MGGLGLFGQGALWRVAGGGGRQDEVRELQRLYIYLKVLYLKVYNINIDKV